MLSGPQALENSSSCPASSNDHSRNRCSRPAWGENGPRLLDSEDTNWAAVSCGNPKSTPRRQRILHRQRIRASFAEVPDHRRRASPLRAGELAPRKFRGPRSADSNPRYCLWPAYVGATGFEPTPKAEANKRPRLARPRATPPRGFVPIARKAVPASPTDHLGQGLHA